ncbi:MAG: hypothetical protein JST30_08140 [Armatimonadetes bacterium]|nr:hypothetical protein [Armatimonadota bacterium]
MTPLRIRSEGLDVALSVNCGQVFRWTVSADGSCLGMDGDHWWHVAPGGSGHVVQGSGGEAAFAGLFQTRCDWVARRRRVWEVLPELRPALEALPGLRLLRPSDPVEVLFCFLCTSNNHLSRIRGMVDRLSERGPSVSTPFGTLHRFPDLETIAGLEEAELRRQGFGYRAATIPRAARQALDRGGADWLRGLKERPHAEARTALMELAGVGPKLADCVCLFGLGQDRSVPVDTHVWQVAVRTFFPEWRGKSLTSSRYEAVAGLFQDRLGDDAGWAHQFCFYGNVVGAFA